MDCYISRCYKHPDSAGTKAKTDMEAIVSKIGFRNIGLKQSYARGKIAPFFANLAGIVKAAFKIKRGDRLFLQYPLKKYFSLICRIARLKGAYTIALIHDLGSFRRKALAPEQEIKRLSNADYVIAANESMKQWLLDHGLHRPIGTQQIWDYLSATESPKHEWPEGTPTVCYAGTLRFRKNKFLYEWGNAIENYCVNLYGTGFEKEQAAMPEKFETKGFVPSDQLIAGMEGQFGLVWDGDAIDECSGDYGEYLKYNNPHKTSLYIRAGLPVIVWSGSALADFVRREGIGFAIDSLSQINEIVKELTAEKYQKLLENIRRVSRQMAEGRFIALALAEAEKALR